MGKRVVKSVCFHSNCYSSFSKSWVNVFLSTLGAESRGLVDRSPTAGSRGRSVFHFKVNFTAQSVTNFGKLQIKKHMQYRWSLAVLMLGGPCEWWRPPLQILGARAHLPPSWWTPLRAFQKVEKTGFYKGKTPSVLLGLLSFEFYF